MATSLGASSRQKRRRFAVVLGLDLAFAAPSGNFGPNRAFTEGPWVTDGEYSTVGCIKDQAWFCETCCCKHGNPHWRDYKLGGMVSAPDLEGNGDAESLGDPKPTTAETVQTTVTEYQKWDDGQYRYTIVLNPLYPEDCQVCSRQHSCSADACNLKDPVNHADGGLNIMSALKLFGGDSSGGNFGAAAVGALSGPAGGDALDGEPKGIQAALWASQPPSLLELAQDDRAGRAPENGDYYYVAKDRSASAPKDEDFGWVPSCCDVGHTRDEENELLPCDYGG